MKQLCLTLILAVPLCLPGWARGDDPVFSGPQVGETLPSLAVASVLGETAGQEVDIIKQAGGQPVVLVFVHARTRPGFGLTNMLMRYTATRVKDGLFSGVVFLTDDATSTEQWMRVVKQHFSSAGVTYGISHDGIEGPGSYGLNRNMTLTVLVGKDNKVTANFALVQPSIQADGPKILQAIVDAAGGGKVPTIAELEGMRYQNADRNRTRMKPQDKDKQATQNDPKLTALLRAVINKEATPEEVQSAATKVEEYIAENKTTRQQLGRIATTVVNSGKLANYGTEPAQKVLRKWAKEYGAPAKPQGEGSKRE